MNLRQFMTNSGLSPEQGGYSLRKVKGKEGTGEVSVTVAAIKAIGGVESMTRRLVSLWLELTEVYRDKGWGWFDEGHEFAAFLAETYEYTTWQVAQVISVLSPQNPWDGKYTKDGKRKGDGNRLCAVRMIDAFYHGGRDAVFALRGWGYAPDFLEKACKVLEGIELDWSGAPKTYRFARLLDNPRLPNVAVCDSHASRIATGNLGGRYHVVCLAAYALIEKAYLVAAEILDIPAYVLQAGLWVAATEGLIY